MKPKKKSKEMNPKNVWIDIEAQPFPYLHELTPMDRDRFVLLDTYLRGCIEEWFASGGQLATRSIVLLDDCARTITKHFKLLHGEGQYYFGNFRRLARQILRGINIYEAYCRTMQEMEPELDGEYIFDEYLPDIFPSGASKILTSREQW